MEKTAVKLLETRKLELEQELENLISVGRKEVAEEIKTAREFGDLSENAEYDAAKEKQRLMEERIIEIEETLKNAIIIKEVDIKKDIVSIGTTVTLLNGTTNKEEKWLIVGATEANPFEGKISDESPVGKAIIGSKAGKKVKVETPQGNVEYTIVKIKK